MSEESKNGNENNENEMKIYKNDQIHNLLLGKQPRIGRANQEKTNSAILSSEYTDFSKFPFPDPIEPINSKQMGDNSIKRDNIVVPTSHSSQFAKLRNEESLLQQAEKYLNVYENNHRRKTLIMHQEYEEHFLQPLSKKLLRKVNGPEYDKYLRARTRAISAFDKQTRMKDVHGKEYPTIPTITYDRQGIVDPVTRFREHAQREKELTTIIAKQTGEYKKPTPIKERDTLDLKRWEMLTQTRFYDGSGTLPKGKRLFPQKYTDHIDENDFDPLPEVKVGRRKSYIPKDHELFP